MLIQGRVGHGRPAPRYRRPSQEVSLETIHNLNKVVRDSYARNALTAEENTAKVSISYNLLL